MSIKKIPLYDATPAELRLYATTILGLVDVKPQHKASDIIAKMLAAAPDLTEIEIEVPDEKPATAAAPAPAVATSPSANDAGKSDLDLLLEMAETDDDDSGADRYDLDPRVSVTFSRSADVTKPQTVQIAVNGATFAYKRGVPHKVPYRVFLANLDAIETIGRETDEVNQAGLPIMEFSDQPSYPMEHIQLPPLNELIAWHREDGSRPPARVVEIARQMQRAA